MISFTEGGLTDVWPDKESPQIQALSYAMQQAMIRVKSYADQAMCYSMVDDLPEDILDYFAVEMRAMYYEQNLSIEQKREIVKNTLKWYTYAGTPATVADMVTVVFGKGEIQEWFDYTDPPFTPGTFDIITSARLTPDIIDQLASMIKKAKNVRSHIRGVVIVRDIHSDAHVAIHQVAVQESNIPEGSGFMLWKIALVYTIGILISEPVYIWAIRTLTKMEDEDERLYCSDNGEYYEPGKPNYPALVLMVIIGGLIWPLALLFGIFIPITFILMDKMGQLHPDDEDFDQDEDNYL